jgi:hypothetical protein
MVQIMRCPVSKELQNARRNLQMIAAQARQLVIACAGPMSMGETVQRGLERAARRLGFTYARTHNIYLQRAKVSAFEWVRLNEEAAELAQREKAREGLLHENDLLARDARARLSAARDRKGARLAGGQDAARVEQDSQQGGARPDLLKRKRYWAG